MYVKFWEMYYTLGENLTTEQIELIKSILTKYLKDTVDYMETEMGLDNKEEKDYPSEIIDMMNQIKFAKDDKELKKVADEVYNVAIDVAQLVHLMECEPDRVKEYLPLDDLKSVSSEVLGTTSYSFDEIDRMGEK